MNRTLQALFVCISSVAGLLVLGGCEAKEDREERVLKIGVIAPLTGPAQAWGEATLHSAEVVAEYYNERGGIEVDGEKLKIELVVRDDSFDPSLAAEIAYEMVLDDINYVIGPVGSASVSAASNILDGGGVLYVHYGLNQAFEAESSLGILGMPMPEQSLPLLYEHLAEEKGVEKVLVMAYASEGSIGQKATAESIAKEHDLELVKLSRFDVAEESFDFALTPSILEQRVLRVVAADPDLLVLVGCPPSVFVVLVDRLRSGGYEGVIAAQNFQDALRLSQLGEFANDVYFVGGSYEGERSSVYFDYLKERYLYRSEYWSVEAEAKMYALEFILECVRQTGIDKYEDTAHLYATLDEFQFDDPFYNIEREVMVSNARGVDDQYFKQIQLPIRLSKIQNGVSVLVAEKSVGGR